MLVLPIVNYDKVKKVNKIKNVKVCFKNVEKISPTEDFKNCNPSDVFVNQSNFLGTSYKNNNDSVVEFIRNFSLVRQSDYFVTTKEGFSRPGSFDVYRVSQPPKFVNAALDNLYASVITDMRLERPDSNENYRGRDISLEKLGFHEVLTDEKMEKLEKIVKNEPSRGKWPRLFEEAGISDIPQMFEFLKCFEFTVISGTSFYESEFQNMEDILEQLNNPLAREWSKYHQKAKSNQEIYSKLSKAYYLIYQQPYSLIMTEKQKSKLALSSEEIDYSRQKVKIPNEVVGDTYELPRATVLPN